MTVIYLLLFILAGVFFGLSAGRVPGRYSWLALGLLCFAIVNIIRTARNL